MNTSNLYRTVVTFIMLMISTSIILSCNSVLDSDKDTNPSSVSNFEVTELFNLSTPDNIRDCMNGGWENFNFKNQGQCIRFVRTGKDSRDVPSFSCGDTITDVDNNVYTTVQIGNQCWTVENLKTSKYSDGSDIPNIESNDDWVALTDGAWSYYKNDESFNEVFGKYYNWFAVEDERGICPVGWKVPENYDWMELRDFVENDGNKLKDEGSTWNPPNAEATNETGFTAIPVGARDSNLGVFFAKGEWALFWSTPSEFFACGGPNQCAWGLLSFDDGLGNYVFAENSGLPIRCILNE